MEGGEAIGTERGGKRGVEIERRSRMPLPMRHCDQSRSVMSKRMVTKKKLYRRKKRKRNRRKGKRKYKNMRRNKWRNKKKKNKKKLRKRGRGNRQSKRIKQDNRKKSK